MLRSIIARVVKHEAKERRLDDDKKQDHLLTGLLSTLATLVKAIPEFREFAREPGTGDVARKGAEDTFVRVVIDDLLFYTPSTAEELDESVRPQLPKCKNKSTRKEALALLSALCEDSPQNVLSVSKALVPVMSASAEAAKAGGSSASSRLYDEKAKADHGYLGYRNLGCICYMNAMMQQLYMVPHWRLAVLRAKCDVIDDDDEDGAGVLQASLRVKAEEDAARDRLLKQVEKAKAAGDDPKAAGNSGLDFGGRSKATDDVLYQLQRMYANQMMSERQYYNPLPWCQVFKDSQGNPIKTGVQQDAEEYLNKFFDKMERRMADLPECGAIRECFGGTQVEQRVAPAVGYTAETVVQFTHWPLEPKGFESLEDSLKASLQGETMEGYKTDVAPDIPTTLVKRSLIQQLPNVLMFHIKRLQFSMVTFMQEKINSYLSFPDELDMYPYTKEGVLDRE